jgi:diacylglycerol kinase family enzyme
MRVDVGRVAYRALDGSKQNRYVVHVVSFGMGGEVAARSKNFLQPLGGTAAFFYATLVALSRFRGKTVELALDDADPVSWTILNIAVGNGRFHGGGMEVCPKALLNDGVLEVTVIEKAAALELARGLPALYSGDIYKNSKAHHYRARNILASSVETTRIEIDGEPLGTLPLHISVLPQCLQVLVPAEADRPTPGA